MTGDRLAGWSSEHELRASVASVLLGFGGVTIAACRALQMHEGELGTLTDDELHRLVETRRRTTPLGSAPQLPDDVAPLFHDMEDQHRERTAAPPPQNTVAAYTVGGAILGLIPGSILLAASGLGLAAAFAVAGAGALGHLVGRIVRRFERKA
jgi:hypothetical protein